MIFLKNNRIFDLVFIVGIISLVLINFFALVEASEKSNDSLTLISEVISTETAKKCQICLEDEVQSYSLKCEHSFCESCIARWARTKSSCPTCRVSLNDDLYLEFLVSERIKFEEDCSSFDLHEACKNGLLDVINFQIENGVNVRSFDIFGLAPLHVAIVYNRLDVVEHLIKNGANIDDMDVKGISSLRYECIRSRGNLRNVKYLLSRNADPNLTDESGVSPLLEACKSGRIELITLLLNSGGNLNIRSNTGDTPLRLACQSNSLDVIRFLVSKGQNLNNETELMHIAANRGNKEIIKYLVDNNVDMNSVDYQGYTPLNFAFSKWRYDIINLLIENGAGANFINKDGFKAIDIV